MANFRYGLLITVGDGRQWSVVALVKPRLPEFVAGTREAIRRAAGRIAGGRIASGYSYGCWTNIPGQKVNILERDYTQGRPCV